MLTTIAPDGVHIATAITGAQHVQGMPFTDAGRRSSIPCCVLLARGEGFAVRGGLFCGEDRRREAVRLTCVHYGPVLLDSAPRLIQRTERGAK